MTEATCGVENFSIILNSKRRNGKVKIETFNECTGYISEMFAGTS